MKKIFIIICLLILSGCSLNKSEIKITEIQTEKSIENIPLGRGSTPIPSGLVAHWTFDSDDTNWATGYTYDVSGNGNHGKLFKMATATVPTVGKIRQGYQFDSVNDEINLDLLPQLNFGTTSPNQITNAFTFAAWAYPTFTTTSTARVLYSRGATFSSASNEIFYIAISNTNATTWQTVISDGVTLEVINAANQVFRNIWQYMTVTWDGTTFRLYKNGVQVGTDTDGTFTGLWDGNTAVKRETSIGANGSAETAGQFWVGKIDDVRFYDHALTQKEVYQLWRQGVATHGLE